MSREAFETAALAAHPTGESSPLAAQTMRPVPMPAADGGGGGAARRAGRGGRRSSRSTGHRGAAPARPRASTSPSRKIPFADKDVEKDADAARELAAKAAKMGIPTDRVPVIDVRGRLLLGFDQARIETLLGERDVKRSGACSSALAARRARSGARAAAEARVMDLRFGGNAGGMSGWGTTTGTPDLFGKRAGPGFGFEAGLKLLIFDFSVDVHADRSTATAWAAR